MTEQEQIPLDTLEDSMANHYFNEGLEWAAGWLESYLAAGEQSERLIEFTQAMIESIRAAKKPTNLQMNFFQAIRNDPYMSPENKAYWLQFEGPDGKPNDLPLQDGESNLLTEATEEKLDQLINWPFREEE